MFRLLREKRFLRERVKVLAKEENINIKPSRKRRILDKQMALLARIQLSYDNMDWIDGYLYRELLRKQLQSLR